MTLALSDIAIVASVQHTGTWFTINFLRNFFPHVRELTFLLESNEDKEKLDSNYNYKYDLPLPGPTVAHIHFPIVHNVSMDIDRPPTSFEKDWAEALSMKRAVSTSTILMLCNFFKVVIPVRDPVAAILSRETRHPQFRHFFIVDGYVALATEFAKHPNVVFLPIDMVDDVSSRMDLLKSVMHHCSVDMKANKHTMILYANRWAPENVTPGNELKALYNKGNIAALKERLGPKWAEIEYLRNMASIILPWMASLGYTRERLIKL